MSPATVTVAAVALLHFFFFLYLTSSTALDDAPRSSVAVAVTVPFGFLPALSAP